MTRKDTDNGQAFIRFAVEKNVIQFGEFTLKSKRVAPYFFNTSLFHDGQPLEQMSRDELCPEIRLENRNTCPAKARPRE